MRPRRLDKTALPPRIAASLPPVCGPGGPWGTPPAYRPPTASQKARLQAVYARLAEALGPAQETCEACGQCCRFTPDGMVLFASSLELAYLVSEVGLPPSGREVGVGGPWVCVYQEANRCAARHGRTLGCRTYFCRQPARATGEALHAEALGEIQRIARSEGGPWWYGPARVWLAAWTDR